MICGMPILHKSNVLLSKREIPFPFVGWVAVDEFEDLFSSLTGSRIVKARRPVRAGLFGKIKNRLAGPYPPIADVDGGDLLLVVARAPIDLQMLLAIPDARKKFRYIAGYVIDSYYTENFPTITGAYDHIFSTTQEGADAVRSRFGTSSSVLAQGFDCLTWASLNDLRGIDLIGFGRQPQTYHREFQRSFHTEGSPLLYLHSPLGAVKGSAVWDERPMMLKLLQRSKLSLAFHLGMEPETDRPRAATFVTSRWFESLATGCLVVGKRPPGKMAKELFCWPDALIELPDNPVDASAAIVDLAANVGFLRKTRARNVVEMIRRHDWRYRIREIYQHFDLQLPAPLIEQLASLEQLEVLRSA
jgi:Glycosyl transferases group 1